MQQDCLTITLAVWTDNVLPRPVIREIECVKEIPYGQPTHHRTTKPHHDPIAHSLIRVQRLSVASLSQLACSIANQRSKGLRHLEDQISI